MVSTAHDPVHITGVSAVPVPGDPTGRLVHAGILTTGASIAAGRDWPPVPVRPLIGSDLPRGQSGIVFGLSLSFNLISIHIRSYAEYSHICPGGV
jgi:hypothetical protein